MTGNDVLRSLRYLLESDDATLARIIALGGGKATRPEVTAFMLHEEDPGHVNCPHHVTAAFLNGLIIHRRGRKEDAPPAPLERVVTNNVVLKKLRVAFELKDTDLLELMADTGCPVSKSELSALFRKPGHHNFRPAGDQFLRNFLKRLTARVRGASTPPQPDKDKTRTP